MIFGHVLCRGTRHCPRARDPLRRGVRGGKTKVATLKFCRLLLLPTEPRNLYAGRGIPH